MAENRTQIQLPCPEPSAEYLAWLREQEEKKLQELRSKQSGNVFIEEDL